MEPVGEYVLHAEAAARELDFGSDVSPASVAEVGVIGAGTMGRGIAIALLVSGLRVKLFDRDQQALLAAWEYNRSSLAKSEAGGRIDAATVARAQASLTATSNLKDLSSADLMIEAAYETIEVKREIFAALDLLARPGVILATNTSYLDIDAIAAATSRPGDVVGMHFFSPANIMKLLEVVRGKHTSPRAILTAFALAERMGKQPVLAGNAHGFIGNRMMAVRRKHAEELLLEGADLAQVDRVVEDFGFRMGPFRMGDLAGLDLGWTPEASTGATIRERLCEAGRRGQKTRAGFYDYDEAGRSSPSAETERIVAQFRQDHGIVPRNFSDQEILDRQLWPMVDEGAQLLAEGIARRESDIDVVWLHGYRWPRDKGGPMYHARSVGLAKVCHRLEAMGLAPSLALTKLAETELRP